MLSRANYILFHVIVEFLSIVIASIIFTIAWNARKIVNNRYMSFLGTTFLFVAFFSLLHTSAYRGMGVFPTVEANLATQLWIITRYLFGASLLGALLVIRRKISMTPVFVSYSIVSALLLVSVFYWDNFPKAYIEESGLTMFKVASEFVIAGILGCAIVVLFSRRREFDVHITKLLAAAMAVSIAAEMAFTLYTDIYMVTNLVGHLLNAVSFYLIYKALVETALTKPFTLLFRSLKQSEKNLEKRAGELTDANAHLESSLDERKKMAEQLEHYGKQLEIIVEQRTKQLKDSERLAAIGENVGMVGHDIRNPLQAVVSELYLQRQEVISVT